MDRNRLLNMVAVGEPAFGCQIRTRSAMIAEVYGRCGLDYAFIEGEHFGLSPESVEEVVRACDLTGMASLLRLPDHDPGKIMQFLDMGVTGLLLPHVDSGEQARAIVSAGKYRPLGRRGFSNTSRATGFGDLPMEEFKGLANRRTMLIAFIESEAAIEDLDAILASGIDAVRLGPGDLSECIPDPDERNRAMDQVIAAARAVGIPVACVAASIPEARDLVRRGVTMISYSSDLMLLKTALSTAVRDFREQCGGAQ